MRSRNLGLHLPPIPHKRLTFCRVCGGIFSHLPKTGPWSLVVRRSSLERRACSSSDTIRNVPVWGGGEDVGAPQTAPQLPAPLQVSLGDTGKGRGSTHAPKGVRWDGDGLCAAWTKVHPVQPIPALQGGDAQSPEDGAAWGQYSQLQTCCPLSSVGSRTLAEGRRNQHGSKWSPRPPYAPLPAHLAQMGAEVDVQRTPPTILSSIIYCLHLCLLGRLSSLGKHQGCLQKQLKNL